MGEVAMHGQAAKLIKSFIPAAETYLRIYVRCALSYCIPRPLIRIVVSVNSIPKPPVKYRFMVVCRVDSVLASEISAGMSQIQSFGLSS